MSILHKINDPRDIYLFTEVNDESIEKIVKQINDFNVLDDQIDIESKSFGFTYERKPINLFIDTYGGSLMPTFGLINLMDSSKTPIHTYSMGRAMSAGFAILISGKKRYAYKNTTIMYHQLSKGVFGTIAKIENEVELGKRLQSEMEDIVIRKTKLDSKTLKEIYDQKRDVFYTSEEALKLGIVDEII